MTVNTGNIVTGPYVGNDSADSFSYDFRIENKTQIEVYQTIDDGVQAVLTVDTDYTVDSVGDDAGGTITRVAGVLPTGYKWWFRANYEQTQLTAFGSQGGFFPDVHETAMDKMTFLIQQLQDESNRSIKVNVTSPVDPDELVESLLEAEENAVSAAASADADAQQTALDRIATGEDVVATGEDVVATGEDVVAAQSILNSVVTTGDNQVARVITEGDTQDARVIAEGDTQDARVIAEGDTQEARLELYANAEMINPLVASSVLTNWTSALSIVSGDLIITGGYFNYTNGKTEKGYTLSSRTVTESLDATGVSDGFKWPSVNSDGTVSWFDEEPTYTGEATGVSFNLADGKWYEDDVLMVPSPSFIPVPVMIAGGEVQYLGDDEIATNVQPKAAFPEGLVASELTEANANVKIVDFGTVATNNRYVIDNPFGNDKWEGCSAEAQIYLNNRWSRAGFVYSNPSGGYGTEGHSNLEGIVVQTGSIRLYSASAEGGGGHGYTGGSGTSAPCRVIVKYTGDATNA